MKILLASDHAGFELKNALSVFLRKAGHEVLDFGPESFDPEDDYPDFVAPVAAEISQNQNTGGEAVVGIVVGGSGQGEAIIANRFLGVRATVFNGQFQPTDGRKVPNEIILSREHNNANILALGAKFLNTEEAIVAVSTWLSTPFSGEPRHLRRVKKIDQLAPLRQDSSV